MKKKTTTTTARRLKIRQQQQPRVSTPDTRFSIALSLRDYFFVYD